MHTPHPFLIRFNETFGIRYYGLAYLAGFVGAAWLLHRYFRAGRSPLDTNALLDLMTALLAGVIVGGRLGYFLLYQPSVLFHDPLVLVRLWEGGMASHGGFLGVMFAMAWFTRKREVRFLQVSDLITSTAPLGLMLGRIANFLNGELWGKQGEVPWAMIFEQTGGGPFPRHPSQLYEALLEGLVLFAYMQWRFWRTPVAQQAPGRLSGEFLVAYAAARAVCEVFREPDAGLIFGLSRGSFYSIFVAIGGIVLMGMTRPKPAR
ncbi:MAG: prolipoprotein diacylglyceryl transferase [Opitutaceae bacterium]|nr:prolipoprotein diacylglyceryl transferase [Opitutaceae bacterium]